ncbi:MAG: transketolase [Bacteroidetes bacterium]|nr:transketolase [Bacteroidota bacterium]
MKELEIYKKECLLEILRLYKKANAGHIASSLSCLDILIFLYFRQMSDQDHFILSKGHAALGLYTVLAASGKISQDELETFYEDGAKLAAHPPCSGLLNGIVFGTGSLGHGLSLAAGKALSTRFTGKNAKVYCLLSDGDCNEGSTWEAALFAGHHKLNNLIVIIDNNGLQGFGSTIDILDMTPMKSKWDAFNFDVYLVENGNDLKSLQQVFQSVQFDNPKPKCIIAKTIKGSGISFMENKMEWHYLPMTDEQYSLAIQQITS